MIRRALELKKALITYAGKLRSSKDAFNKETFDEDYLTDDKWVTLEIIKEQLQPLFYCTKSLEGNADLTDGARKASYGALWEVLSVFEDILSTFESLEQQAKNGDFNDHPGIQSLITLVWNKTQEYYIKTDALIAWMALLVLHPRWKWAYFEKNWTGEKA
jgi:hypothetical protein